jgi:hypothetical protein
VSFPLLSIIDEDQSARFLVVKTATCLIEQALLLNYSIIFISMGGYLTL